MYFPLSIGDVSLWLAVVAIILIVTSELLHAVPSFAARVPMDKRLLRFLSVGCGLGFLVTVLMRAMGMG